MNQKAVRRGVAGLGIDRMLARRWQVLGGVALATAAQLVAGPSARGADDQYFDSDGLGAAPVAESGQWDTSRPTWSPSATTPPSQTYVDGNNALFIGPGGSIAVPNTRSVQNLTVSGGSFFFRVSPINWGDGQTPSVLDVAAGANVVFNVASTGSGGLTKTGAGAAGFVSTVVPAGPVDVQQGTLYYAHPNGDLTNSNVANVAAGATLDLRTYNDTFGGLTGDGTVRLGYVKNFGTFTQDTGSILNINTDSGDRVFNGSIVDNAPAGVLGGKLTKSGSNTFTLTGTNSYKGVTNINLGTLEVVNGQALPDTAPVNLNDNVTARVTLRLQTSETIGSLAGGGTNQGAMVEVGGNTLSLGGDNLVNTYTGNFDGNGVIRKIGTGLQSVNTVTNTAGLTTTFDGKWRIEQGTLAVARESDLGLVTTPGADRIQLAGGTFANSINGGFTLSADRGVTVSADSGVRVVGSGVSTLTVNGNLTGSNRVTKTGIGTLAIGADNSATFSGTWAIREGTLRTSRNGAAPLGTGSIDIRTSALVMAPAAGSGAVVQAIAGGPGSSFTYGPASTLAVNRNGNTSYTLNIGSIGGGPTFNRGAGGTLVIAARSGIDNLGSPTAGEQILVAGGVPTTNGIVPGVFGVTDHQTNNVGEFLGYDLAAGFRKAAYTSSDLSTATATSVVEQAADVTLAGPASAYALKVGTGGPVAINAGANAITVGSGQVILNNGAAVNGGTLALGSQPGVIQVPGDAATVTAQITGSGGLTKLGQGALTLGAAASYTGTTTIGQGAITLTGNDQLPVGTTLTFGTPGGHDSTATTGTVSVLRLAGNTQHVASLQSDATYLRSASTSTPPNQDYGAIIDFGLNGKLIVGSGDSTYKGGSLTDAASTTSTLQKDGTGTLTLGEVISPGNANIRSAVLSYNKLWVTGGGVVSLSSTNSIPNQPPSATGIVNDTYKLDNGTLRFTSIQTGVTSIIDPLGTRRGLQIGAGGGTIDVTQPMEIVLMNGATNLLNGGGTLTKTGPGILRFAAQEPGFTGKVVINEGLLQITGTGSLGASNGAYVPDAVTIQNGGVFASETASLVHANAFGITAGPGGGQLRTRFTFTFDSQFAGTGPLTKTNDGTFIIQRSSPDYSGTFTQVNGVLDVRASTPVGTGKLVLDPTFPVTISRGGTGTDPVTIPNDVEIRPGTIVDIRNSAPGPVVFTGKISGAGDFFRGYAIAGTNTVTFTNGNNDFTGRLTGVVGVLSVTANGALGSTNGATILQGSSTLAFDGGSPAGALNYSTPEPLFVLGNGTATQGVINNIQGNNTFAGPIAVTADSSFGATDGSLDLTGRVAGISNLTKVGPGKVILSNPNNTLPVNVDVAAGELQFGATHHIKQLKVEDNAVASLGTGRRVLRMTELVMNDFNNPQGTVDLRDGIMVIDYDTGLTPDANVRSLIKAGYGPADPHWTGKGITSSTAAADTKYAVGYAEAADVLAFGGPTATFAGEVVDNTTYLVRFTLAGDATLDGSVDFNDLVKLAQNYNVSDGNRVWSQGDFTYDGNVDFNDLVKLAQNYNTSLPAPADVASLGGASFAADWAQALSAVPEPGTVGGLAVAGAAAMLRRRRRRLDA